jgi:tRNA(Ile2) C34 agmatinyltransferase TiaS
MLCLRCEKPFESKGKNNRLCKVCGEYVENNEQFFERHKVYG